MRSQKAAAAGQSREARDGVAQLIVRAGDSQVVLTVPVRSVEALKLVKALGEKGAARSARSGGRRVPRVWSVLKKLFQEFDPQIDERSDDAGPLGVTEVQAMDSGYPRTMYDAWQAGRASRESEARMLADRLDVGRMCERILEQDDYLEAFLSCGVLGGMSRESAGFARLAVPIQEMAAVGLVKVVGGKYLVAPRAEPFYLDLRKVVDGQHA